MSHKATIAGLAAAAVVFFVLAGVWVGLRADSARLGMSTEDVPLDKIVLAAKREQFWFNAMFISGNIALVFLAHFGALRHRRRVASKRTAP